MAMLEYTHWLAGLPTAKRWSRPCSAITRSRRVAPFCTILQPLLN